MPKKSRVRFTKVYPGGYRAIARVSKAAGVLAVLMRFSDQVYNRFGYNPCTSAELRGGVPVSIPVNEICELTDLTERQVANAIATLKRHAVYGEHGEKLPLLEQLEPAHNGRTAVYALHVENEESTKPFKFFAGPSEDTVVSVAKEPSVAGAIQVPCVEDKAAENVANATGMDGKGAWIARSSYCDNGALILGSKYPYNHTNETINMRGDEQKTSLRVVQKLAYSECPKCGSKVLGKLDEAGAFAGYCEKCKAVTHLPEPIGLKAVRDGGDYVFVQANV